MIEVGGMVGRPTAEQADVLGQGVPPEVGFMGFGIPDASQPEGAPAVQTLHTSPGDHGHAQGHLFRSKCHVRRGSDP